MKKISFIAIFAVLLSGCVAKRDPICYATMNVGGKDSSVPIFYDNGFKGAEYYAGYPIMGWTDKEQFSDFSQCLR